MFKVGTYVSYRAEGVCVISDIRMEAFNAIGKKEEFYILSSIKDMNSLLYVPVNNELLTSKMRPLLSAEEVCALADELRDERMEWIVESRVRNSALRDILTVGDRRELMLLVNTINDRIARSEEIGRKITAGDENVRKRALRMLIDEFSVTTDIKTEEHLLSVLDGSGACAPRDINEPIGAAK